MGPSLLAQSRTERDSWTQVVDQPETRLIKEASMLPGAKEFTGANVQRVPKAGGTYVLFDREEVIYYGQSDDNIALQLERHLSGAASPCTQKATHFLFEVLAYPWERYKHLMMRHVATNKRRPRCNDQIP
jgi:hypothetical protein